MDNKTGYIRSTRAALQQVRNEHNTHWLSSINDSWRFIFDCFTVTDAFWSTRSRAAISCWCCLSCHIDTLVPLAPFNCVMINKQCQFTRSTTSTPTMHLTCYRFAKKCVSRVKVAMWTEGSHSWSGWALKVIGPVTENDRRRSVLSQCYRTVSWWLERLGYNNISVPCWADLSVSEFITDSLSNVGPV